eukprot:3426123-Rhodomonas_salina.1
MSIATARGRQAAMLQLRPRPPRLLRPPSSPEQQVPRLPQAPLQCCSHSMPCWLDWSSVLRGQGALLLDELLTLALVLAASGSKIWAPLCSLRSARTRCLPPPSLSLSQTGFSKLF